MLYLMRDRLFDNLHAQHVILYNSSRRHASQSLMLQQEEETKKRQRPIIFLVFGTKRNAIATFVKSSDSLSQNPKSEEREGHHRC
jgi:hypothetical protein